MNELPKSVARRLAEPRLKTLVHPEADLLTAFVERALNPVEYDRIMTHLGDCGDCRQVVSLAAREAAAGLSASTARSHSFWRWPVLQWGSMAASAAVLVAVAGFVLRPELFRRPTPQETGSVTVHTGTVATLSEKDAPSAKPQPAVNEADRSETRSSRAKPAPSAAGQIRDSVDNSIARAGTSAPQSLPSAAPPPPPPLLTGGINNNAAISGTAAAGAVPSMSVLPPEPALANQKPGKADPFRSQSTAELANQTYSIDGTDKGQRAPSSNVFTFERKEESKSKIFVAGTAARDAIVKGVSPVVKTITPQLSFGPGVGGRFTAGGNDAHGVFSSISWSLSSDGKLMRKRLQESEAKAVQLPTTAPMKSLIANGLEAWVGGAAVPGENSGALFYTSDAGEHWQRLTGPWTGEITTLSLSHTQPRSITLRTANGEWQSADEGKTWIPTQ
jgi:Putative zinc-finger